MATPKRKPKSEPEALKQEPLSEQIILWIERLCLVPEGRDVYKPLRLRDWQKVEIRKIYDNKVGTQQAFRL
jgi:hypothetical protein